MLIHFRLYLILRNMLLRPRLCLSRLGGRIRVFGSSRKLSPRSFRLPSFIGEIVFKYGACLALSMSLCGRIRHIQRQNAGMTISRRRRIVTTAASPRESSASCSASPQSRRICDKSRRYQCDIGISSITQRTRSMTGPCMLYRVVKKIPAAHNQDILEVHAEFLDCYSMVLILASHATGHHPCGRSGTEGS
ncbi:hypothetical protein BC629DRAFT_171032 [Irpex lacteus]|nr:hypothetical protein BC629DRAFT_171032 [Irpex lacteus]